MSAAAENFRFAFAFALFIFGLMFLLAGFWKLLAVSISAQAKAIAVHSARLSQKALAEDITRIAQNANQLIESINNLLRTSAGIGAFLVVCGSLFLFAAYASMFLI
jgi:ABC-type bacteriocin/lantibiotic exporter with double-glycine peptidase domain